MIHQITSNKIIQLTTNIETKIESKIGLISLIEYEKLEYYRLLWLLYLVISFEDKLESIPWPSVYMEGDKGRVLLKFEGGWIESR